MTYIRQCAWCKKILGVKVVPSDTERADNITHTICPACSALVMSGLEALQPDTSPQASAC